MSDAGGQGTRDRLILIDPASTDPAYPDAQYFCFDCIVIEGVLAAYPQLRERLDAVPGLIHTDWQFLEAAYTPAFLGSIGHGFNRDYVFVIDYDAQTIAFHPYGQDATALSRVIDPARVVATLPFTPTGVDGKMPEVDIRIGDETITARFDTGNLGTLELTEAMQARLESQGRLHISASPYTYGAYEARRVASLNGLSHLGQALHDVGALSFTSAPHNRVGLGYQFLRQYVTVWDYRARTLTLLAR